MDFIGAWKTRDNSVAIVTSKTNTGFIGTKQIDSENAVLTVWNENGNCLGSPESDLMERTSGFWPKK